MATHLTVHERYPLTSPVEKLMLASKMVHSVAGGLFFICLERELTLDLIRAMAERKTKGTKDFLKLRTSEADKVRCGKVHFEALGVPFAVVVTADEV